MCEAGFRSEVKCVNESDEGGERVRGESVFLRVYQSLVAVEGGNTNARLFPKTFSLRPQPADFAS